jgi:signal transduction histidine kinase
MSQPEASDKVREYLDIIEKETRTSDKIVTDLLDFTRIKSVDREKASVPELVRQTLERYPAPSSVEVTLEIPTGLPEIYADPQQVVQILINLVTNACQAMTQGGKLTVSATRQSDMICIDVQDTGPGIPPENMDKLFQPLFTTKSRGIGLGLAVSRKLAEANGGRIEAESAVGQGSTFSVYLPVFKP